MKCCSAIRSDVIVVSNVKFTRQFVLLASCEGKREIWEIFGRGRLLNKVMDDVA